MYNIYEAYSSFSRLGITSYITSDIQPYIDLLRRQPKVYCIKHIIFSSTVLYSTSGYIS